MTNFAKSIELIVICSLKEFNAYRNFLENKFLKLNKAEFEVEDKEVYNKLNLCLMPV